MTATPVKPKILVIEDQPGVSETMIYLLKRVGCEAVGAKTGTEGMRLAQAEEFDLITLDIDLPDISGLEVCRRLKQDLRLCHTPVIFVTGRLCELNRDHCFELGAADYIVKPFDTFVFVSRIFFHLKTAR
jgi:two-component system catabolic regulation response regulator CreB